MYPGDGGYCITDIPSRWEPVARILARVRREVGNARTAEIGANRPKCQCPKLDRFQTFVRRQRSAISCRSRRCSNATGYILASRTLNTITSNSATTIQNATAQKSVSLEGCVDNLWRRFSQADFTASRPPRNQIQPQIPATTTMSEDRNTNRH